MALKVHRVVVVSCPRCVLTGDTERLGVGKSCFCNRFVRPDSFKLHHASRISEDMWRDNPIYNSDHFLYWGAATKRHQDSTKTRFQVVEQTEFFDLDLDGGTDSHRQEMDYISRASATHFISRGKVAYRVLDEEEYAIPSAMKSNPMRSRAVQLFPNSEFSEGKGVSGFICLFDPTLEGENIKIQFDFLTRLINELLKTKRKIVVACTKCDEVNSARIQFGANLVASIRCKKPIPYIQTSAKEGINIEEAFNYIISNYNKKTIHKSGKNSIVLLGLSYAERVKLRSKDVTFAKATFNRILHEKVHSFGAEWGKMWPVLRQDQECLDAVNLIGEPEAKKLFCQRLMALKVTEAKEKRQVEKNSEESRSYQNELLEAFTTHKDLVNESAYDFVYSPSLHSINNINATPSPSSLQHSSFSFTNSTTEQSSPVVTTITKTVAQSPPRSVTMAPICVDPGDIFNYRNPIFSPTRTCLTVNSFASKQLNRSTEILATLPRNSPALKRHSSVKYKNRTLPPLPFHRPEDILSPFLFSAKSQPMLDEMLDSNNDPTTPTLKRKLSSSIDCLHNNNTIDGQDYNNRSDMEPSPYLRPIEVISQMTDTPHIQQMAYSMRQKKSDQRPSLPTEFLTLGRNRKKDRKPNPRLSEPPVLFSKPRSCSSPPPVPPSLILHTKTMSGPKPILIPEDESSLDCVSSRTRVQSILERVSPDGDNVSIVSGPFTEVDDVELLPPLMSEIMKSNESLSRQSNGRKSLPREQDPTPSPTKEGIYASIPAAEDEEYLTMNAGISMEDLLQNGIGERTSSSAKAIVKRLQLFTNKSESDMNGVHVRHSVSISPTITPKGSPGKIKKEHSGPNVLQFQSSRQSFDIVPDPTLSPLLVRGGTRATLFNNRPLPESPTKVRKAATIHHSSYNGPSVRRKSSIISGGDSNIYESIDGEHQADWLKQMKHGKYDGDGNHSTPAHLAQYREIMDHFLSNPQVQELWKDSVRSVYPSFEFPEQTPPLLINTDYFSAYRNLVSEKQAGSSPSSGTSTSPPDDATPTKPATVTRRRSSSKSGHTALSKKESLTDQVLARLNQNLLMDSSSEEESEDEYTDESDTSDTESMTEEEMECTSKVSLSTIRENFKSPSIEDDLIIVKSARNSQIDRPHGFPLSNGFVDNNWFELDDITVEACIVDGNRIRSSTDDDETESGTGSSSPNVPDLSAIPETVAANNVVHPATKKIGSHVAVCHFNSLDSGIFANGNTTVEDHS